MKCALVLEKDAVTREKTVGLLRWMGYITAPVYSADEALNVASSIDFKLIITHTATHPFDQRSLIGELKRVAPRAAIVLVIDHSDMQNWARQRQIFGVSAVLMRPPTAEALRRIIDFGIDGDGLQPGSVHVDAERRRKRT